MTDKPSTDLSPSDKDLDAAYQAAVSDNQPSQLVDKRIANLAKQQATKIQQSTTKPKAAYTWSSAPWWASAASLACVSVLSWWLYMQTGGPSFDAAMEQDEFQMMQTPAAPNRVTQQSGVASSAPTLERELLRQQDNQMKQQKSLNSKQQIAKKSEMADRSLAMESQIQSVQVEPEIISNTSEHTELANHDLLSSCIELVLSDIEPTQLTIVSNVEQKSRALAMNSETQISLSWQQQQWQVVKLDPLWIIIPDESPNSASDVYELPKNVIHSCVSPSS
ncbi:hypothetical protein DBZ36_10050 [Alginatibacterium sediminis]|uniref:Uncharacterized protein n=1 Tax=Alginatibacterium sediminis TaxID=2164068 RepID=A0A420EDM4_9ALTE|nr:hypothetical protein [Alginatibacterium sediminis]RKF18732.1 hypothetical protein DBZ36_10050 [Alginatibacterium sediminis]